MGDPFPSQPGLPFTVPGGGSGTVAAGDPGGFCDTFDSFAARAACKLAAGVADIFFDGGDADPTGIVAEPPCFPGFSRDPITRQCVFDIDPGPGTGFPGNGAAAGSGLTRPNQVSRQVLECPRFADGKTGILWMNALTGDVICLPRRTSGRGFGLIRKNKPRKKAFISAAQKKSLDDIKRVQGKAKKFAEDAGFSCKKR